MRVKVRHHIDRLADDYAAIPGEFDRKAPAAVSGAGRLGLELAKALAREKAGPHGAAYYKRLGMDKTGPLEVEYGPDGVPKTDFVGVGFRHGRNTDLPKSADKAAADLAERTRRMVAEMFQ